MARQIQENWKTENILRFDRQNDLVATVALSGLADWVALRKILDGISFINRFQLVSISRGTARVRLEYFGDEERLNVALNRSELELLPGAGDWVLQPRSAGGATAQ
jgi:hypothetical protein